MTTDHPKRPKAFSYLRMSTALQSRGDSRRRQLELSQKYAEVHGLDLLDEDRLEDIGISAFTGKNVSEGALGGFLDAVKQGKVEKGSYLLVESLDRISRQDVLASLAIFLSIIQAGIVLVTLGDGRAYGGSPDLTDLIVSLVYMSRAHEESLTKSKRVAAAWSNKRSQASSRPMTKNCPQWLRLSDDRSAYEVVDDRARIVRRIFRDAAGGMGAFSIVRSLNAEGILSFTGSSGWGKAYVSKILTNRAAIGEFQPCVLLNGRRVPDGPAISNYFPAVVDQSTFFQTQDGRSSRRVSGRGRKGPHYSNLFTGFARCAYCKRSMVFENKGAASPGAQYLICDTGRRNNGCEAIRWRYKDFEASFLAFVRELDIKSILENTKRDTSSTKITEKIAAMRGEMLSLDVELAKAFELFAAGGGKVEFVSKKMAELEAKKAQVALELRENENALQKLNAESKASAEHQEELFQLIKAHQSSAGEETYKLRARIAQCLRQFIETLLVAPVGSRPTVQRAIDMVRASDGDNSDVANHLEQSLSSPANNSRFFAIGFKDGTTRAVYPHPDDPYRYTEQLRGTDIGLLQERPDEPPRVLIRSGRKQPIS